MTQRHELTPLESAIMELNTRWFFPRFDFNDLKVVERKHTGVGRYTAFECPVIEGASRSTLGVGSIRMKGLEHGLNKMITTRESRIDELELVTTDPEGWDGVEMPWEISFPRPLKWRELPDGKIECAEEDLEEGGLTPMEKTTLVIMTRLFLPGFRVNQLKVTSREDTGRGRRSQLMDLDNQEVPNGSTIWGQIEMEGLESRLNVRLEMKSERLECIEFIASGDEQWDGTEGDWEFITTWPMPSPLLHPD